MKTCIDCQTAKPSDQFTRNSRRKDGLSGRCRPCASVYEKRNRDRRALIPADPTIKEKQCRDCGETKPVAEFPKRRDTVDRCYAYCRTCTSKRNADQLRRRREGELPLIQVQEKMCGSCRKVLPASEFWRGNKNRDGLAWGCKSCGRRRLRLATYGVTPEWLTEKLSTQNGCCAICPAEITEETCHIDHDHRTGKPRDLLCHLCNKGLGHFKDNLDLLIAAAEYLERHSLRYDDH